MFKAEDGCPTQTWCLTSARNFFYALEVYTFNINNNLCAMENVEILKQRENEKYMEKGINFEQ